MAALLALGFVLSLDNARVAVALGTLRFSWRRAVQVAVVFGFWDGITPLVGLLLGHYAGKAMGVVAEYVGPAVLLAYGGYLIVSSLLRDEPEEIDDRWALFGIPLSLSVDNLVAGAGLGLLGYSPFVSAAVFASVTAAMSFAGLCVGRAAGRLVPVRMDLLSGVALVAMAVLLALGY
ncbi:MAG: manganese efflux pump [Streptosporangiales bacterium]|nr:manganese efflux pump [Streptosporangiales bacterium]MBO0889614.1 manganese efflux pump [Acidothermales bacterium]